TTHIYILSLHDALPISKCLERQDLVRHSSILVFLFEWLTRNGLQNLLHLDDRALAGFFAGAVDADGCFSVKKNGDYSSVSFDLRSEEHTSELQSRFDIV